MDSGRRKRPKWRPSICRLPPAKKARAPSAAVSGRTKIWAFYRKKKRGIKEPFQSMFGWKENTPDCRQRRVSCHDHKRVTLTRPFSHLRGPMKGADGQQIWSGWTNRYARSDVPAVSATPESNSDVTRRIYSAANGDWAINRRDNQTGGIIHDETNWSNGSIQRPTNLINRGYGCWVTRFLLNQYFSLPASRWGSRHDWRPPWGPFTNQYPPHGWRYLPRRGVKIDCR